MTLDSESLAGLLNGDKLISIRARGKGIG
jgi:hypothetical protein